MTSISNETDLQKPPRPGLLQMNIDQHWSLEGEQRAIGLVLSRPNTWSAFSKMEADDFFYEDHALIWDTIRTLKAADQPAELPHVFLQLSSQLGGRDDERVKNLRNYLSECVRSVIVVTGFEDTARLLEGMAKKRRTAKIMVDFARRLSISSPADPIEKITQDLIGKLQANQGQSSAMIDAGDVIRQIYDQRMTPLRVTPTGFPRLDKAWSGGLVAGYYYVQAARIKSFKTTFATSMVYQMMMRENPDPVDYYCLESTPPEVSGKWLSRWIVEVWCRDRDIRGLPVPRDRDGNIFKINSNAFINPNIMTQPWFGEALLDAEKFFRDRGLRFMERSCMNLEDLVSEITSTALNGTVRGNIVDFVQLIRSNLSAKGLMTEHLDHVHQTLSRLSKDTGMWTWAAAQLNRTGDVRGGDGAAQSANMVMHQHKIWLNERNRGEPKRFGMWLQMTQTRYTEEGNIGGDGKEDEETGEMNPEPAYELIGDVGPYLRERPCREVLHREAAEVHPRNDHRNNGRHRR